MISVVFCGWKALTFSLVLLLTCDYAPQVLAAFEEDGPEFHEYCSFETFNVSCGQNEVLLIRSARYGRMRLGKCVKVTLGYIDCVSDVRSFIDARCTGRRNCILAVADDGLRATRPCPTDVTWHLEVSHVCVKVLSKEDSKCRPDGTPAPETPHSFGFIASLVPIESHYGRDRCPWILTVEPGQRIRLVLKGYYTSPAKAARFADTCIEIGAVLADGGPAPGGGVGSPALIVGGGGGVSVSAAEDTRKPIVVCGAELIQRDRPVYLSETNRIALALTATSPDDVYLMVFEAVGCPALRLAPRSWSQRSGEKLVVGCNDTDERWSLVCRDSNWVGQIGNCTSYGRANERHRISMTGYSALPFSILIAVAVGVALGIFIGGALLAVVGSRMNRRHKSRLQDTAYATTTLMPSSALTEHGGTIEGKRGDFDQQFANSEDFGRRAGVFCAPGGDYSSNSMQTDQTEASDRATFCRQGRCSIPGGNSPFTPALHHHHHHLIHHPYESPVIIT